MRFAFKTSIFNSSFKKAHALFLALLVSFSALAQDPSAVVESEMITRQSQCLRLFLSVLTKELETVHRGPYRPALEITERMREALPGHEFSDFDHWYNAHFFYSRESMLLDNLAGKNTRISAPRVYDKSGQRPFDGYLAAKMDLAAIDPGQLSLADISRAHRKLLSKDSIQGNGSDIFFEDWWPKSNSEGTRTADLGRIRDRCVGYTDTNDSINSNSLSLLFEQQSITSSPKNYEELSKINPFVKKTSDTWVEYTPLSQWRRYQDKLPEATRVKLEALEKRFSNLDVNKPEINAVRQQVVTDLVQR